MKTPRVPQFDHTYSAARIADWKRDNDARRAKYAAMRAVVEKWAPPTSEHVRLKSFMLEQLQIGDPGDWVPQPSAETTPRRWLSEQIKKARDSVTYDADQWRKENDRCAEANEWIAKLAASVPQPEPPKESP